MNQLELKPLLSKFIVLYYRLICHTFPTGSYCETLPPPFFYHLRGFFLTEEQQYIYIYIYILRMVNEALIAYVIFVVCLIWYVYFLMFLLVSLFFLFFFLCFVSYIYCLFFIFIFYFWQIVHWKVRESSSSGLYVICQLKKLFWGGRMFFFCLCVVQPTICRGKSNFRT